MARVLEIFGEIRDAPCENPLHFQRTQRGLSMRYVTSWASLAAWAGRGGCEPSVVYVCELFWSRKAPTLGVLRARVHALRLASWRQQCRPHPHSRKYQK